MLQALESWLTRLGFEITEKKRQADETLRIKIALDNVSTGVMITNPAREIIYTNESVMRILKEAESEIHKALPNFSADNLIGANIDNFHKNPKYQADLLASLVKPRTIQLTLGNRRIQLIASPVINEFNERLGSVVEWSDRTEEFNLEDEKKRVADEMARIKIALDNVSTGVMIANAEREIIYANESVIRILKEAESEIHKALPNFSADKLIGANIDGFHKNPKHQADMLASLTKSHTAQLTIGNRRMQLIASPVINKYNERLGSVVEWSDRTDELKIEEDKKRVADEMARIKSALDNVSTGVMIANTEREIIYANDSVTRILKEAESEIHKALPNFNADKLIGVNIDSFHKNPKHQADMLANLMKSYTAQITIGNRRMQLIASPVINEYNERLGSVVEWSDRTDELNIEEDKKRVADEMARIKIALDNVSTGIMIADTDRKIIYVNSSIARILKKEESEIRKVLPAFSADNLIGTNIDSFHKNPKHQADLLGVLNTTYSARFKVGNRHVVLTANPVINNHNKRLGTVAEWLDRTAEARVEEEVADIVQGAQTGNFDKRLSMDNKEGFFKTLSEGLNNLAETTSTGLNDVARVLQAVAHGDLTQKIDADYAGIFGQLKNDTNATVERLREIIGRIQEASVTINSAAQQISAGNADLSSRTEEQASSLEETSTSMEELNSTVKQNAENAKQANQLAQTSNDIAIKSGQMVQQIVSTMTDISESSKKITDIIGVIDSIAFQTNILALNAAVEAARAGEQGRGFAVVATEVRNLAHRSATAAKEIKELIIASGNKVDMGTKLVDQAGQSMAEVISSFKQVAALVTDITQASHEQSCGIEQVTAAINHMDDSTQQNAALVEESTAAAESLEEQAHDLVQAVSMFKLVENEGDNPRSLPGARSMSAKKTAPPIRSITASTRPKKRPPKQFGGSSDEEWEEF
jgi:methyl-accepting chemotaxis protein